MLPWLSYINQKTIKNEQSLYPTTTKTILYKKINKQPSLGKNHFELLNFLVMVHGKLP
jgi:DNA-binding winged helix-turn-helix (wHTH) protein